MGLLGLYNHLITSLSIWYSQRPLQYSIWLVVGLPLWKICLFVNWDDESNPIFMGKYAKLMLKHVKTKPPTIYIYSIYPTFIQNGNQSPPTSPCIPSIQIGSFPHLGEEELGPRPGGSADGRANVVLEAEFSGFQAEGHGENLWQDLRIYDNSWLVVGPPLWKIWVN